MGSTSNDGGNVDYASQLVTPFFTRAQLYAFSIPPSNDVIEKVNKGGQQDYIPHEYIRALLDRYIGTGRWEMQATLHSTDKEIVKKVDYRTKAETENVAATANVNVSLVIHAQDGSDKTLVYSAVGSNTQYAGVDKGYGSIIGNAISSAESLGLKRAATNLGRAFGFDLKSKVKKEELPPSIAYYTKQLNEREASRNGAKIVDQSAASNEAAAPVAAAERLPEPAQEPTPAEPAKAEAPAKAAQAEPAQQAAPAKTPADDQKPAAKAKAGDQAPAATKSAPDKVEADPAPAKADPEPQQGQTSSNGNNGEAGDAQKVEAVDWELSIRPTKFEDWLVCLQTMGRRLQAMTAPREIDNFIRRYSALIKALPIIPAEGDRTERNFRERWRKIVEARYTALGAEVPKAYRLEKTPEPA